MTITSHHPVLRTRALAPRLDPAAVLRSRRTWLAVAVAALLAAAALKWSWLVVAGVAPLLIKLLPCAAMCALGLCARSACRPESRAASVQGAESDTLAQAGRDS